MIINNRDNRRLLLRCFLLAIIAFSKPAAAQSRRPFSPGLLIFDAEAGGPIQTQAAVLLNQEPFVSLLATSSCPWATIPSGRISGRNLFVTVNPLLGATGINTCNILVTREVGGASVGTLPVTRNLGNT